MSEDIGRSGVAVGLSSLRDEAAKASSPEASIPNADCAGKRHYPSRSRAVRGMKALLRAKGDQMSAPGSLDVYRCACGEWCVGHSTHRGRPAHKRTVALDPANFTKGARLFEMASAIARARHPDGANASQLAQILREILAAQKPPTREHSK